jgi:hypothetical protein
MLIASTRNTLIKQLGGEKFGESIFTTEKHELTAEGFKKHEAHTKQYVYQDFADAGGGTWKLTLLGRTR